MSIKVSNAYSPFPYSSWCRPISMYRLTLACKPDSKS